MFGLVVGYAVEGTGHADYDDVAGQCWPSWTDNMSMGVALLYGREYAASGKMIFEGETCDPMTGGRVHCA